MSAPRNAGRGSDYADIPESVSEQLAVPGQLSDRASLGRNGPKPVVSRPASAVTRPLRAKIVVYELEA